MRVPPRAARPRPQRLAVLPVGRPCSGGAAVYEVPVRLVPGGLAILGPALTVPRAVFVFRRVVGVAPESGRRLARRAEVVAWDPRAAKAVEIPKFLCREG